MKQLLTLAMLLALLGLVLETTACSGRERRQLLESSTAENDCPPAETTTVLRSLTTSSLAGRVVYDKDRSPSVSHDPPLEGVKIIVRSTEDGVTYLATTGENGRFRFSEKIPQGSYILQTCLEGWDALELPIQLDMKSEPEEIVLSLLPS